MHVRTLREVVYRQLAMRRARKVLEGNVRLPLPYHEVNDDERLEDDGPC
jgi:hypothetical protein